MIRPSKVTLHRRDFLSTVACLAGSSAFFPGGAALGKKKKKLKGPPTLADRVNELALQLPTVTLDESDPLTSQIQKLVFGHVQEWLANAPPSGAATEDPLDVLVRREMEKMFSELHYPIFGDPVVLATPWKGGTLVVAGYTLGWTDTNRVNPIALFEKNGSQVKAAAATLFVQHTDLALALMPAPEAGQVWFLAFGKRLGKSQPRLSAALYAFDGQLLKNLWEQKDFYDGNLDIENNRVVINYLREDEYIQAQLYNQTPSRYEATYQVSLQGLTLVNERTIPFQAR